MKIAFILSKFPSISETFIINQIVGLIKSGQKVKIFAEFDPKEKYVHPDVLKYNLLKDTFYYKPKNKIFRVFKIFAMVLKNFFVNPAPLFFTAKSFIQKSLAYSPKITFLRLWLNLKWNYLVLPEFLSEKFDIVHCHFGPNGIIGIKLKQFGVRCKIITSFHGDDANSIPRIYGRDIYKELFSNCDCFTANTNFTKNNIVQLGCSSLLIDIIPVGLKIEEFQYIPRHFNTGDRIKILTVGRLVEKKGHFYAIQAISKLINIYNNVEYIIVGDGPLKPFLQRFAEKKGISEHVTFLGNLDQEKIVEIYRSAHIFVLPSVTARNSDREGQALVLQEAQLMGLPVISTLHNGIPDGVLDGKSGFLVPEKDVDALVEKLIYLIKNPTLWDAIGTAGRMFVESRYDINILNDNLIRVYKKTLSKQKLV